MDFGVGLVRLVGSGGVLNHSGHESHTGMWFVLLLTVTAQAVCAGEV